MTMKGLQVRRTQCRTCIYRPDSPLKRELGRLEAECQDAYGHFQRYRICHTNEESAVCKGFFRTHGKNCTPIQIAERLKALWFSDRRVLP